MEVLKDLEKALNEVLADLKPAQIVPDSDGDVSNGVESFESVDFDYNEKDNRGWIALIAGYLNIAKTFEIHCWNEEPEWTELALRYGERKEDDWKYGKIVAGAVTPDFIEMILSMPKPADCEIYNKMTPFFNIFLDDIFYSSHYGTENHVKKDGQDSIFKSAER